MFKYSQLNYFNIYRIKFSLFFLFIFICLLYLKYFFSEIFLNNSTKRNDFTATTKQFSGLNSSIYKLKRESFKKIASILNNKEYFFNKKLLKTNSCDPINHNYKQHYVTINKQTYPKSIPLYNDQSINFDCLNRNSNTKTIFAWTPFMELRDYGIGFGIKEPFRLNNCPVTNCEFTNDMNKLNQSDFVLSHMLENIKDFPAYRPENQRWLFMLYESPHHNSKNFSKYNRLFNLSSTYRIDSDIAPYYETQMNMVWQKNDLFDPNHDFYAKKTKFATAVISHQNPDHLRMRYINELKQFIQVDLFGKAGKPCPGTLKNNTRSECKQILADEYKFFFSFENSFCGGYITEKFFEILQYNIIPVVLGGGEYEHYVIVFFFYLNHFNNF